MQEPLKARLDRFKEWATGFHIGMPLFVGAVVAGAAILLTWSVQGLQSLWLPGDQPHRFELGPWMLFVPAVGGLLVGPLVTRFAREAKGHGVPEVMLAVSHKGGRIHPKIALIKTAASAITIGSGGSVGREGPIVQIGSALGSSLGQLFRMPAEDLKLLVACGAAAGISATFNAPIAGAIFASEVILREFKVPSFSGIVLASVTAAALTHAGLGQDAPAFRITHFQMDSGWEIFFYAALGLFCGGGAVLFTRMTYWTEDLFDRMRRLPEWVLPAVGGLLVGIIGLYHFEVLGSGYAHIQRALNSYPGMTMKLVLALFALKLLATCFTVGSGGSGGIFAPSLFMGAMVGSAFGGLAQEALPVQTGPFAVVGMGAFFAGTAHAPVTAILMIFEMTREPMVILPLMTAVVISTLVARRLFKESIYTMKLRRRGLDIDALRGVNILDLVTVEQAMVKKYPSVDPEMPVPKLIEQLKKEDRTGYPVIGQDGALVGVVTFRDVSKVLDKPAEKKVSDICTRNPIVVYPDETLNQAMLKLATRDVGRAPVMSRDDAARIVGMLERRDIIGAATRAARDYERHMRALEEVQKLERDVRTLEVEATPASPVVGRRVRELELPEDVLLVAIRRGKKIVIPRGATVVRAGDRISVLVTRADEAEIQAYFKRNALQPTGAGTARF